VRDECPAPKSERTLNQALVGLFASAKHVPGLLQISVIDTGIGSPPTVCCISSPRSARSTAACPEDSRNGLGLAMVKLFAELHGGTVAVESTESAGSTSLSGSRFARRKVKKP
jgi:light-regulated signal transduction histidine kinase (bacteriophytochrome)